MIIVHCACGEVYKIADDKAGYSLICAKCKRVVDLAAPSRNIPRTAKLGRSKGSILLAVLLVLVALVGYNFNPAHQNLASGVKSKPQTTSNSQTAPLSESLKAPPARSISSAPTHLNSKVYIPTAKEMAGVDRQVSLTPKPQSSLDQAVSTGTNISEPVDTSGRSTLTVINGNLQDAVIKLVGTSGGVSPNRVYRYVYIKAKDQAALQDIPPGDYTLLYKTGSEWNDQGSFTEEE